MKKINTQRVLLTALVAVAFFGFLLWSIQQTQSEEASLINGQALISANNSTLNSMIRVNAPKYNSEIKSPVLVSGQANLSGNKLKIRIKDNKNLILKEATVQTKNASQMSDFSANLTYKKPSASQGTIEVFLFSAKDSSELYKISIPIVFKD